ARLLVVEEDGEITHYRFSDLPHLLRKGDILSFNDSKVVAARLAASRLPGQPGAPNIAIEVTLHQRAGEGRYRAFAQPARRLTAGDSLLFRGGLTADVLERAGREILLAFNRSGRELDLAIAAVGAMPLPPYIAKQRPPDGQDFVDYQTVYAREEGSVAAPTAGLHFTDALLERLRAAGIGRADLTLHV